MTAKRSRHKAAVLSHELIEGSEVPANGKVVRKALMGDFFLEDFHDYGIDRTNFVIYVGGDPRHQGRDFDQASLSHPGVDFWMSDRLEKNLEIIRFLDPEGLRPVKIILASCGGSWEEGIQMFSAILAMPNPVTIVAVRDARSMTSLIALAGDRFLIRPPAKYMIHKGHVAFAGTTLESETSHRQDHESTLLMLLLYTKRLSMRGAHTRLTDSQIRQKIDAWMRKDSDVWFSADEAVRHGFADGILLGSASSSSILAKRKNITRNNVMWDCLRAALKIVVKSSYEFRPRVR
jgi:ATP-dependent protease ClpP protease subunit